MTPDDGLTRASLVDLERLRRLLETGRLAAPLTAAPLQEAGLGGLHEQLAHLGALDAPALIAVLGAAIAERTRRPVPHLDLVWTGPDTHASRSRDTAVVVRELFQSARRSVLVAGYAFAQARELLAPLHEVMRTHGVSVSLFVNLREMNPQAPGDPGEAAADLFLTRHWPFGPPRPVVYYDPTKVGRADHVTLHAKVVVVDEQRTLITSANFTSHGQEKNIELGVLIEDPAFARQVAEQWLSLVPAGAFKRAGG